MQVSVETTGSLERRMTVEVPEVRVSQEVQSRLERLAKTTRIKGFRPGKVPFKVVQQQYGQQVRQEVMGDLVQSTYYEALAQEKLRPAGAPQIEPKSMDAGMNLEYTATFEVFPEVKLSELNGVNLERITASVTDADVDKLLDNLRKQRAIWEPVERAAQDGDRVTIDFKGTVDGEEFKGNEGKSVPVVLGSNQMIAGFEEGLVGAKAGEERVLDVTFPENYGAKELAGKAAKFAATVQKVEESHLPEVDEEFATSFGVQEGGVEGLRAEVRRNMERELEQAVGARNKQLVMDRLVELNPMEVPKALVHSEAHNLLEQMQQNMRVPKGKNVNLDTSMFEEQAQRRVTLGLILSELISSKGIKPESELVKLQVEKLAASYEHPEEVVNWYYSDKKRLSEVESLVLEDQVVNWVFEQANTSNVSRSFDEVMNPAEAG